MKLDTLLLTSHRFSCGREKLGLRELGLKLAEWKALVEGGGRSGWHEIGIWASWVKYSLYSCHSDRKFYSVLEFAKVGLWGWQGQKPNQKGKKTPPQIVRVIEC